MPVFECASITMSAQAVQTELKSKITQQWRLTETTLATTPRNITSIFRTCGILSARELEVTEVEDSTALLSTIHSKEWSAVEVVTSFCKRAASAQQLVNPLVDITFDEGIQRAKELDDCLQSSGEVVGPLHGLLISFKDLTDVEGMKIATGFVSLANRTSDTDAVVVQSLREAGAVVYCPVGRSLWDIELILRVWNDFEPWLYDPVVVAKRWDPVPIPWKIVVGVMYWDEVFKHYYPTGGKMFKDFLTESGEPAIPSVAKILDRATELSAPELTQLYK
ncbi:uncharacterized protein A1O9_05337 [Exophiala aquamarina CBS 119918]|uniref:Amidase domain-containing protein n=1 Tax=Exophiala aquamarina CBS 119918 TaxID=1182545 RepID=A0A072PPI3_9EURO|nr:uncharacterized protein A1O9_05337 [Exophiala aquamarina CBS 119918]KEF57420.1 hypothetical protein A1O9_05337 [Exophiala aquamarina CBS 119918]